MFCLYFLLNHVRYRFYSLVWLITIIAMVNLINLTESVNLSNYTLIIPSVSVGNVGQLTIDLIITSFNLKKVGTVWHPGIVPSVGGDPYQLETEEPCTACELYVNEALKIAVIQLRSSIEHKWSLDFFKLLKAEILNSNIPNVVILTTIFAYELHNIESSLFRYISNAPNNFENFNILPVPLNEFGKYVLNGVGFAMKLYELLEDTVKCTIFAKYVSEGDNRPDAIAMFNILKKADVIKGKADHRIKIPISWNYVFGNPPPMGIF